MMRLGHTLLICSSYIICGCFPDRAVLPDTNDCPSDVQISAALNLLPISYAQIDCTDSPLIDARNVSASIERDARFALSQYEHDRGISGTPGDTIEVVIYVSNDAQNSSVAPNAIATNVSVTLGIDTSLATLHRLQAFARGANANEINSSDSSRGGDIYVYSGNQKSRISFLAGSASMCAWENAVQTNFSPFDVCSNDTPSKRIRRYRLSDNIVTSSAAIGSLQPGSQYSRRIYVRMLLSR